MLAFQAIFDLVDNHISIQFVNGTHSRYTFNECEEFRDRRPSDESATYFTQRNSGAGLVGANPRSAIRTKLLTHLEQIQSLSSIPTNSPSPVALVSAMNQRELSVLKKSTRPLPLAPSESQTLRDLSRPTPKAQNVGSPQKSLPKKRRAPGLGLTKTRKKCKLVVTAAKEEAYQELDLASTIDLPRLEIYELVSRLSSFRSTLYDIFQINILSLLKLRLPPSYPLWVVQSELEFMREQFEHHASSFIRILEDNASLKTLESTTRSSSEQFKLAELTDWCRKVATFRYPDRHGAGDSQMTSAETSLTEPAPRLIEGMTLEPEVQELGQHTPLPDSQFVHLGSTWADIKGKAEPHSVGMELNSDTLYDSISIPIESIPIGRKSLVLPSGEAPSKLERVSESEQKNEKFRDTLLKDRTPPLSPSSGLPDPCLNYQLIFPADSILHFPTLALEPTLLATVKPEPVRERAIELSVRLAEERIAIDVLDTTVQTITLLEEERIDKERFAGLDRFSDVITASRLSGGWGEGHGVDNAQDATIAAALNTIKARTKSFAESLQAGVVDPHQAKSPPALPHKQSEAKRRLRVKRRTWLAVTGRLDRSWITPDQPLDGSQPIWPEPIFLPTKSNQRKSEKKSKRRRSAVDAASHVRLGDINPQKYVTRKTVENGACISDPVHLGDTLATTPSSQHQKPKGSLVYHSISTPNTALLSPTPSDDNLDVPHMALDESAYGSHDSLCENLPCDLNKESIRPSGLSPSFLLDQPTTGPSRSEERIKTNIRDELGSLEGLLSDDESCVSDVDSEWPENGTTGKLTNLGQAVQPWEMRCV